MDTVLAFRRELSDRRISNTEDHLRNHGFVYGGVATWRRAASRYGLSKAEIDRMASAFEHEDREKATRR